MIGRRDLVGTVLAAGALPLAVRAGAQAAPIVSRIALVGSRLLMAAKIGTNGPFLFAIDTGGDLSLIDHAVAQRLKMKPVPGRQMMGIGGRLDGSWYNAGDVTLANGMRLPQMLFAGLPQGLGEDVIGSFGAGLFTTFDSDLDMAKGEWRTYPGGRPDRAGWTRLPSHYTGRANRPARIEVDAALDGYTGRFLIDTGAPGMVSLDGPAAKASGLWNDEQPYAPVRAAGIGKGRPARRIVRAGRLKIGKFVFERPLVSLSTPGAGENLPHDGAIGLSILSRLNLSSEVKAETLWVQPSGVEPVQVPGYSRSGIWFGDRGGRVVVDDVGTGSPARAAGVMPGDVAPGISLDAAIRSISGPAGREVTLKLERAGVAREAKFALADYL